MSRVRISIDAGYLGEVEITQDDRSGSYDPAEQRLAIDALLVEAVAQARAALRIEPRGGS